MREELGKHLSALRRENVIGLWHDRMIGAGDEWKGEIDRRLESAGIILLLVSPDFIASDYCYDIETKRALERHAEGKAVVIPIVRLQSLVSDLKDRREGLGLDSLDYLVISGDLTNRGGHEEFEKVHYFLSALVKEMKLTGERTIIVPGNHDLSWDVEVYEWMQERRVDIVNLVTGSFVKQGKGYLIRDDARYPKRFANFARFHHEFKQLEYSLKPELQSLALLFEETRIQFLALNSAWLVDEFHPERSAVNEKALAKGLIEADRQISEAVKARRLDEGAEVLRIAIWHHPVTGNEKIADDDFLERLRKADFKLCLHGHIHEDRADLAGYLHSTRRIHIAGAGSFGAVADHRPPSTPRLYNLIEIPRDHGLIRVHTRCMRKQSGAWEGWAVRSLYEIKLKK